MLQSLEMISSLIWLKSVDQRLRIRERLILSLLTSDTANVLIFHFTIKKGQCQFCKTISSFGRFCFDFVLSQNETIPAFEKIGVLSLLLKVFVLQNNFLSLKLAGIRFFDPGLILFRLANPPGLLNRKVHFEMEYLMVPITPKWPIDQIPSFFAKLPISLTGDHHQPLTDKNYTVPCEHKVH